MKQYLSIFLLLLVSPVMGQFVYELDQEVPVVDNDRSLQFPWAGGLNAPQFNKMDLNDDGEEDLIVFDRASARILPFLSENNSYVFAPEYQPYFPEGVRNWVLLRDYNCDGKKDIFTSDPRGIVVYENTTEPGETLSWRIFNKRMTSGIERKHLLTQGFSSIINLQVNSSDMPAIDDVDGDGDLDVLAFRFSGASTIEWHKNMSMELDSNCDSLQFERVTQTWGEIEECQCGTFALNGAECPPISGGRTEHQGGKSMLLLDVNNDGVKEMLVSEELCSDMYLLENGGSADNALITSVNSSFPASDPAGLFVFPASYSEDVDFDGIKDLLVAPNITANVSNSVNFESSSHFYKNTGTNNNPNFQLTKRNFLQDEMIEVGENAAPAFADLDDDGDLDLVVGSYLQYEEFGFRSILILYKNDGTPTDPSFVKESEDYLQLSLLNFINIKPSFHDVDRDGNTDLVFSATALSTGNTEIYYFRNVSGGAFEFDFTLNRLFVISDVYPNQESYQLHDMYGDGLLDILIGRSSGRLEYYRNIGSSESPAFQLEDETFYGFDYSPFRQLPSPTFSDFDGDGTLDMLVGDGNGNLMMYDDFSNNLENPKPAIEKLFRNNVTDDSVAMNLGGKLLPVTANLFNADKPSIVVGTGAGGLMLLKHTDAISTPVSPIEGDLAVYPNPVRQSQSLRIGAKHSTTVAIISITGQVIFNDISIGPNKTITVDISHLKEGMYMAVGKHNGGFLAERFVVVK